MSLIVSSHRFDGDRKIEQDVRAEVAACAAGALTQPVGITVDCGVVHLTGSAETYSQKLAIERAASRVIGVKEVRDYLDVRLRDDDRRDDGQIERAATAVLRWDARVPDGVRAAVTDGVVRLDGVVERFAHREAAEEAVRNLVGVCDVVNEIRLAPARSSPHLASEVAAAIRRRFAYACRFLAVSVDEGVVRLSGVVSTFALLNDVERAVRSVPGVKRIENQLLVAAADEASSPRP